jgi:endonuclease G
MFRARVSDYKNSGYDRGHLAPAADFSDKQSYEESFILSNISPQVGGFNRVYWKAIERFTRGLTSNYDKVHIVTGPLFLPKMSEDGQFTVSYPVIGQGVPVPTHFFKVIVGETGGLFWSSAFLLPNHEIDAKVYTLCFDQ